MYKLVASTIIKDLYIRDMIAKCFYTTPNKVSYNLELGQVINGGQVLDGWRVIIKGKRVRLEFKKD